MAHPKDDRPSANLRPAGLDADAALAHFKALFASAPIGLGLFDRDLRYLHVNATLAAINGQPAEAHLGRTMREVIPQIAADLEAVVRRVIDTGEIALNIEWSGEVPGKPGEQGHWLATYYPVDDSDGRVFGAGIVVIEVTAQKRAEEALAESLAKLRLLARQQVAIREEERGRLGLDLHDDVCQELLGVGILVESIRQRLGSVPAEIAADFGRIVQHLGAMIDHVRGLAQELQPIILRDLGLEGALRSLAEGMSSESVRVVTQFTVPAPRLPQAIEVGVYRVVQEAVSNALRHASPRTVVVRLTILDGTLHLEVRDDGRGFDTAKRPGALGLIGMEERALAIGARFGLRSKPGKGTTVSLDCPLP